MPAAQSRMIQSDLPLDPETAAFARRLVERALTDWNVPELIGDTTIVVSELVTNAILYGKPPLSIVMTYYAGVLIGQVRDQGEVFRADEPLLPQAAGTAEHGRGLAIVAAFSNRWGVAPLTPEGEGKAVWFTMLCPPRPRNPSD